MLNLIKIILSSFLLTICPVKLYADFRNDINLYSPDNKIKMVFSLKNGIPHYSISYNNLALIHESRLGVQFTNIPEFGKFQLINSEKNSADEAWKPVWGTVNQIRNHYNRVKVLLQEQNELKRKISFLFRVYNDGVGFRYVLPKQEQLEHFVITEENTEFRLNDYTMFWGVNPHVETGIIDPYNFGNADLFRTPLTVKIKDDCYLCIHEAGLDNHASMNLGAMVENNSLFLKGRLEGSVTAMTPHSSPWRTILITSNPGDLIESNLILNLNEPCELEETSWIKPGKCMWDWRVHAASVNGFIYDLNTESMKRFIDFAANNGIEYAMIDAGWYGDVKDEKSDPVTHISAIDVPYLAKYAGNNGVGLWLYLDDKALANYNLDRTLSTYQKWGVVGIKHGFLSNHKQNGVEWCHKVLKKCAEYQIMYNSHEPIKPTGFRRTYPNFMTREYIHSLVDGPNNPISTPADLVTIPFVNNLGGPLDRTPGMFDIDTAIKRRTVWKEIQSTVVSQVAQSLVIFTGFLCLPDHGEAYQKKSDIFKFIKRLPMTWDETRVINAEIGKYITIARRHGNQWFVASLTNEDSRNLDVPLTFLSSGKYIATLYEDAHDAHYLANREAYVIRRRNVSESDTIAATLAPGGGHAIWLRPEGVE